MIQTHYLLRSRTDGNYLIARPHGAADSGYLLLFAEYADALSYLNAHAPELRDRFAVETLPQSQLPTLLNRWGFAGIGVVRDPLVPQVSFLAQN
ncbi:hypothetical protein [Leptolyngbya sp. FACHB-261]|uniref:hypothetical protein n=1 Tax=Leptolyngbya sp. FACHB-261 TaxID=2692806 RepID=UPI0018EF7717|nr:hypothetical protein [Leptolyngbya sp. FACHB-261]